MNRVVITGIGWITPMGHDIEAVWQRLLRGESGIDRTTLFDAETFPTRISAEVKNFKLSDHLSDLSGHESAGRNTQFALAAVAKAWKSAGLPELGDLKSQITNSLDLDRVGIYLGSGEGSLDFGAFTQANLASWKAESQSHDAVKFAELAMQLMDVTRELEQEPNMPLSHLALFTGARGPAMNCLTACAASTQAIGEATEILRRGDADIMIGGGAHSMIHPFGVTGFNRLTALSDQNDNPPAASRPFDLNRKGFVLGEGAGMVILETLEHAQKRGAKILAEVVGYGSTADAYRITDQDPNGMGAVMAMREALADSGLSPSDVHYVNAHGTGTRENDGNETQAIKTVFEEKARACPVSSIKSMMGHLIAAAGAVELITCVLAIRDQVLPPTMNLDTPDPDCDLDYVPNKARQAKVDVAMSNSFGFGGQNDTIIVKRWG
ncbi:beta-ketoacyl-[acyl-carrier-protein] synthase family protein [Humisphaera borealis]|uniref:3-oxoacyl-[acyl-carrier-protein] synthase 2 n=1 Tax=Humisphaera borealis TaxID=2807512 RepID=A0A7M2WTX5_9BACT|nr:beta-ketoacyl-[acyl-carrier-protein] synthase family protein [Humisphaera borealis]QOV88903.1 beta-ketoacyl-[acyl-carrier-protein] synthase family protein [Humisphaera borealis]